MLPNVLTPPSIAYSHFQHFPSGASHYPQFLNCLLTDISESLSDNCGLSGVTSDITDFKQIYNKNRKKLSIKAQKIREEKDKHFPTINKLKEDTGSGKVLPINQSRSLFPSSSFLSKSSSMNVLPAVVKTEPNIGLSTSPHHHHQHHHSSHYHQSTNNSHLHHHHHSSVGERLSPPVHLVFGGEASCSPRSSPTSISHSSTGSLRNYYQNKCSHLLFSITYIALPTSALFMFCMISFLAVSQKRIVKQHICFFRRRRSCNIFKTGYYRIIHI